MKDKVVTGIIQGEELKHWKNQHFAGDEEVFLLMAYGLPRRFLPGMAVDLPGTRALIYLKRGVLLDFPVGVGSTEASLGGWANCRCRLMSSKRFVFYAQEALLKGESTEALVTRCAREAMRSVFRTYDGKKLLWQSVREQMYDALMDLGWELELFRPQYLDRKLKVMA